MPSYGTFRTRLIFLIFRCTDEGCKLRLRIVHPGMDKLDSSGIGTGYLHYMEEYIHPNFPMQTIRCMHSSYRHGHILRTLHNYFHREQEPGCYNNGIVLERHLRI